MMLDKKNKIAEFLYLKANILHRKIELKIKIKL